MDERQWQCRMLANGNDQYGRVPPRPGPTRRATAVAAGRRPELRNIYIE